MTTATEAREIQEVAANNWLAILAPQGADIRTAASQSYTPEIVVTIATYIGTAVVRHDGQIVWMGPITDSHKLAAAAFGNAEVTPF